MPSATDTEKLSDRLHRHLTHLSSLTRGLPVVRRTAAERVALGHLLFDRAPELVGQVTFVLLRRPGLYSDFAGMAGEIAEDQEVADAYLALRLHHLAMADLCQAGHVHHQAAAVRKCRALVDRVLAGAQHAYLAPALEHARRVRLLLPAILLLREVRHRAAGQSRRPGAGDDGPPAAGQDAPATQPTPAGPPTRAKAPALGRTARTDRFSRLLSSLFGAS